MDSPVSPSQLSTYPYLSSRQSAQNTNGIRQQHPSSFSVSDICPMKAAVRKRSRLGMEDAFRSMDINHEQPSYDEEQTDEQPPCKRQETLHFNIDNNDNFARSNVSTTTTTHDENGETKDSVGDNDSNNQHYNRTIAELRLRLPGSSALINPVDAKIEDIIRKSRLQAMIMTGRNNINSSPDKVRIQDDFNVYLGNRTDFDVDMDADPGKSSGNNLPSGSMFKSRSYSDFSKVEDSDTSMSF